MPYETLTVLIAGGIFCYLYTKEEWSKEILLKFVFLITGISLIIFGFLSDQIINSVNPASGIYEYVINPNLIPFGIGLSVLLIFILIYFIWKIVKGIKI